MTYKINLLSKREMSFIDKTLYFFLNYLRYILVITQLIVIGVLFYRFRIDQNIIDLKDSLDQKREIVVAVKPLLNEAEKVNNQGIAIRKITREQQLHTDSINYLLSVFPEAIFLNSLSISDGQLRLKGTATNSRQLQLFYARLQTEKRFKSVALSNIQREGQGYIFNMVLNSYLDPKAR